MNTEKRRLRRTYAPLTVASSMICHTSSSSPLTQVYDSELNSYEPDRGGIVGGVGSPCMVRPIFVLNAQDGSLVQALGNPYLAQMVWKVNGVDISTLPAWTDAYSINTSSTYLRGTLTIYKNIPVGERCELTFSGFIHDPRTNDNIPVTAGSVVLRTTDKSEDEWSMSLLVDPSYEYDPLTDKLLLYNYKVAQGLSAASSTDEQAADDVTSYRLSVPVEVRRGVALQTSGYSLELYKLDGSTGALTQIEAMSVDSTTGEATLSEVTSLTPTRIDFDLRLIQHEEYVVIAKAYGKEVARRSFGLKRLSGNYRLSAANDASVGASDSLRHDVAYGSYEGRILQYPSFAIRIVWKTQAVNSNTVLTHNEGDQTEYNLGAAGLGQDYSSSEIDQWFDTELKGKYNFAVESSTDGNKVYCDENNVPYIFN